MVKRFSSRRIPTKVLLLLVIASMVLAVKIVFLVYGGHEAPCLKQKEALDRCAPVGEFKYGNGQRLMIPNKAPNKYKWFGQVIDYTKEGFVESPSMAVYWKAGVAAGGTGDGWPVSKEDLVLFYVRYFYKDAPRNDFLDKIAWRNLVPSDSPLPFKSPPGLRHMQESSKGVAFEENTHYFFTPDGGTFIWCPPPLEFANLKGVKPPMCHGQAHVEPGLVLFYQFYSTQISDWRALQDSMVSLIKSWKK